MKWLGGTLAGVFLGFFILIVVVLYRSGTFLPVDIEKVTLQPQVAIYNSKLGPYHESSETLFKVEKILKDDNILCVKTFGLYIDDPDKTDADRLRSELGCLFGEEMKNSLTEIAEKNDLDVKYLDTKTYISGKFRGSPALVYLKVYPKLRKWAEENRFKFKDEVFETYEIKSKDKVLTTVYLEILD